MNRHQIEHIKRRKKKKKSNQEKYDRKFLTNLRAFDEHMKHVHEVVTSERYHLSSKKDCRLSLGLFVNGKQSNFKESSFCKLKKTKEEFGEPSYPKKTVQHERDDDEEILKEFEGLGKKAKYYLKALFPDMKETPDERNAAFLGDLKSKLKTIDLLSENPCKEQHSYFDDSKASHEDHKKNKVRGPAVPTNSASCQTSSVVNPGKIMQIPNRDPLCFDSDVPQDSLLRKSTFRPSMTSEQQRWDPLENFDKRNRRMIYAHPLWDTPDDLNNSYLEANFMKSKLSSNEHDTSLLQESGNHSRISWDSMPDNPPTNYSLLNHRHPTKSESSEMQERLWRNIEHLGNIRSEADQLFYRKY